MWLINTGTRWLQQAHMAGALCAALLLGEAGRYVLPTARGDSKHSRPAWCRGAPRCGTAVTARVGLP